MGGVVKRVVYGISRASKSSKYKGGETGFKVYHFQHAQAGEILLSHGDMNVHRPSDVVKSSLYSIISDKNSTTMVSLYTKQRAERESNATVDIPADVKDALKKFRFKKSTSNSAISGTPPSISM